MDPLFIHYGAWNVIFILYGSVDFSGPMVRYVPIEETVILMCSVIVNHMKRISNTNGRLVDVIVFYPKK